MTLLPDWLAEALLRTTCVLSCSAVLVAVASRMFRLRSPRAEQLAWSLVLIQGLLFAPLPIQVPHNWWPAQREPARGSASLPPDSPAREVGDGRAAASPNKDVDAAAPRGGAIAPRESRPADLRQTAVSWQNVFLRMWLIGLVIVVARGYLRYRSFVHKLQRCATPCAEWGTEWRQILAAAECRRDIPLVVSRQLGPALCWTPAGYRLVVPRGRWQQLTGDQRRAVLQHELAHYQRGDIWRSLAARLVALVHWFNPLAWWAVHRLEAQLEFACDASVASNNATSLGEALVAIASREVQQPLLATGAGNRSVVERVRRLLTEPVESSPMRSFVAIGLLFVTMAAMSVSVSVAQPPDDDARGDVALRLAVDQFRIAGHVDGIAVSPQGDQLVAIAPNRVSPTCWLIDAETLQLTKEIRLPDDAKGWISSITFSPDGTELLWGELHGYVAIWNLSEHRLVFREQLHSGEVRDVAYSTSGTQFATAGDDGVVHVRGRKEPASAGRTFATGGQYTSGGDRDGGTGGARCIAFTPDESMLMAGAGSSGDIFMWRLDNGLLIHHLRNAHDPAGSYNPVLVNLRVAPDGKSLMSAGQRTVPKSDAQITTSSSSVPLAEVRFWDIESGDEQRTLKSKDWCSFGHAALSPDGTKVALAEFSRLQILDAATGKSLHSFALPGEGCRSPHFSPNGKRVYMPMDNSVACFDVESGKRLMHTDATPVGSLVSIALSPNHQRLTTGHADGYVRLWNTVDGSPIWQQLLAPVPSRDGWKSRPSFIGCTSDGKQLVVAGRRNDPRTFNEGVVVVLDMATGQLVREVIIDTEIEGGGLSPDGRTLVAYTPNGSLGDTKLHAVDLESGAVQYTYPPQTGGEHGLWSLVAMEFTADGSQLLVADGNGDMLVLDAATGKLQKSFVADWRDQPQPDEEQRQPIHIWEAAIAADGSTLVTNSAESVRIWDIDTGTLRQTIRHPHDHGCNLAIAPNASRFATADLNYTGDPGSDKVLLYDTQSGQQIAEFLEPGCRAHVLRFSSDGGQLTAGFSDGSVTVWDLP